MRAQSPCITITRQRTLRWCTQETPIDGIYPVNLSLAHNDIQLIFLLSLYKFNMSDTRRKRMWTEAISSPVNTWQWKRNICDDQSTDQWCPKTENGLGRQHPHARCHHKDSYDLSTWIDDCIRRHRQAGIYSDTRIDLSVSAARSINLQKASGISATPVTENCTLSSSTS